MEIKTSEEIMCQHHENMTSDEYNKKWVAVEHFKLFLFERIEYFELTIKNIKKKCKLSEFDKLLIEGHQIEINIIQKIIENFND